MSFGYNPATFPDAKDDPEGFNKRIKDEFEQVQKALSGSTSKLLLNELHVEPDKKQVGMLVLADGTDWNPGSGGGVYCWDIIPPAVAAAWQFLGVAAGAIPTVREVLSADRIYYVATTGSDSNNGLLVGNAFLTINKAVAVAYGLDFNNHTVSIQISDGTYAETVTVSQDFVGCASAAGLIFKGNAATPANVKVGPTTASAYGFVVYGNATCTIQDLQPRCGSNGYCLRALDHGRIYYTNLDFGSVSGGHILASSKGCIRATGNYKISGGATSHWLSQNLGSIICDTVTITITGSPTITVFGLVTLGGLLYVPGNTYSGAVTAGTKYGASLGGVLYRGGSTLPGATAGTCDSAMDDTVFKISSNTILYNGLTVDLSVGYTSTSVSAGTKSSGTFTPAYATGNVQHCTNGGAFTLAPPSGHGSMTLDITNNGSAGAITTSGFTKKTGDAFDTTNAHVFRCFISTGNGGSHLFVQALF